MGGVSESSEKKYNRLVHEKSPYLLQHAENPIWWYPWGEDAFSAARKQNKPVFLSIGYSTCYWCHFMEKDSFEKQDVADILNEHFIAIKVDREERPDVDHLYMTALVSITGAGGWPMSMFLTPDGRPFYGASTIPNESFKPILNQIAVLWKTDEAKIRNSGQEISAALARYLNPQLPDQNVDSRALQDLFLEMESQFDDHSAGFGGGNKFPRPHLLSALLRVHRRSGRPKALEMTVRTLKAMARGGIHDLLAGGFHRYSVDRFWDVPHFEKMLYDNAGLAVSYLEAYQVTKDEEFSRVARKTLDWVLAEMTHPEGGFYSAQDAGDFGEEGDFYAWTEDDLSKILSPEEFKLIQKVFQISKNGNFEHNRNVFHVPDDQPLPDTSNSVYASAHEKLLKARAKRPRPRLDDKVLTDWNGLTIAAMARGYQVLGEKRYLEAAQKAAGFLRDHVVDKENRLLHRWRDKEAAKAALLSDYAFLIHSLLELYQADFDPKWFDWAIDLQEKQDQLFWDDKAGAYFFDDAQDSTLILRSKEFEDMAIPSGNSVSALNLLRLADFTYKEEYRKKAEKIFRAGSDLISRSPGACPFVLMALDYSLDHSKEIAIVGNSKDAKTKELLQTIRGAFLPNQVVAFSEGKNPSKHLVLLEGKTAMKGSTTAYVCEKGSCQSPTVSPVELLKQASSFQPLTW